MRIALVGPGIMPIPPPGWGAVEMLMWDFRNELLLVGHDVTIVNKMRDAGEADQRNVHSAYCQELIKEINDGKYDFVHLHYDTLACILEFLTAPKVAVTSAYPFIDRPEFHSGDNYTELFKIICKNDKHYIFALSQKDLNTFKKHSTHPDNIGIIKTASNHREIIPVDKGTCSDKSAYVAQVVERKQQYKYYTLPNVDFYGRLHQPGFERLPQYKGEPPRAELVEKMRNYGNLVLLSTGENGTPLVIKDALMAGLPIVTNKNSMDDLDETLPFIDVVPDEKADDLQYINQIICENRAKQHYKEDIRKYAFENFSYEKLVISYVDQIEKIDILLRRARVDKF
jgi:hypothetical protein